MTKSRSRTHNRPIRVSFPLIGLDVPLSIAFCMGSSLLSGITLTLAALRLSLGNIPSPAEAGSWSFYGVLIVAIVVMFMSGVVAVRWFASHWLKRQEEFQQQNNALFQQQNAMQEKTLTALNAVAQALRDNTAVTNISNDWFKEFAQDSLKKLTFPHKQ